MVYMGEYHGCPSETLCLHILPQIIIINLTIK